MNIYNNDIDINNTYMKKFYIVTCKYFRFDYFHKIQENNNSSLQPNYERTNQ